MNYEILCERLRWELGMAAVFYDDFPDLGARGVDATLILENIESKFQVTHFEPDRGVYSVLAQFETEEDACGYIYAELTWPRPVPEADDAESRERGDRISKAMMARIEQYCAGEISTEAVGTLPIDLHGEPESK